MACGLPAIVSDRVGCGPDLVEQGVTGGTFPFGDVGALASRLLELADDRNKARAMGLRAQERIAKYSADLAAAGTMQAVEFVLSKTS
jgi:glycosyltransferase involved in cell wall biosynthesis